ncbi:MAG: ECF-type sigma factor [Pyrinomonadaceae bacterium]
MGRAQRQDRRTAFLRGLSIEETAEVLKVSQTTVQREWRSAKAWLYKAISEGGGVGA